jgi:hypothetical protein
MDQREPRNAISSGSRTLQGLPSPQIFVDIAPTFFAIAISHQILWIATNAND